MKINSECSSTGIADLEIRTLFGRSTTVHKSPFYLPGGYYSFHFIPKFLEVAESGECLEAIVITADGPDPSFHASISDGEIYQLTTDSEGNGSLVAL